MTQEELEGVKKRSGKVAEVYYIGRDPIRLEDFGGYLGRRRK